VRRELVTSEGLTNNFDIVDLVDLKQFYLVDLLSAVKGELRLGAMLIEELLQFEGQADTCCPLLKLVFSMWVRLVEVVLQDDVAEDVALILVEALFYLTKN
jgi:hypothetical protein